MTLPRLHLIVGGSDLLDPGLSSRLEPILVAGGSALAIHIRGRGAGGRVVYDCAREALRLADRLGTTVFVNDRIDVALASGAHGVHLREDSLGVREARAVVQKTDWKPTRPNQEFVIGRSCHSASDVCRHDADYMILGAIFPTDSHPGRMGLGVAPITEAAKAGAPPLLAIGGITQDRIRVVCSAGAFGVVVVSGIWSAQDPAEAVLWYLQGLSEDHP